jgi:hypothetical protein
MTDMTKLTHDIDRTGWGSGPWDDEPDRLEWKAHGFTCLILRTQRGNLCGYVGVPPTHPRHGKTYDETWYDVHGGLTYSEACSPPICHVPAPGEPDDLWWFGFDCAHCDDFIPAFGKWAPGLADVSGYRDIAYVREQVELLARQLADTEDA